MAGGFNDSGPVGEVGPLPEALPGAEPGGIAEGSAVGAKGLLSTDGLAGGDAGPPPPDVPPDPPLADASQPEAAQLLDAAAPCPCGG